MTTASNGGLPRTSTRDPDELRSRLEAWLAGRRPGARITAFQAPEGTGMSSETALFDAVSSDGPTERLVARLAPDPSAVPVFPVYDLEAQARTIRLVGERSRVPVPTVRFVEPDPEALGTPFLVMDRVDGRVPRDIMPYTFEGWVYEATEEQRSCMQEATVRVLADLHAIPDAEATFGFLDSGGAGSTPLRRHVAAQRAYYEWVTADGVRSPLLERCLTRLEEWWPADESPTVLSWGDSRIGNVIYRDFEPVAVLDWEMASLGPPELDVGWMIFMHRFFDDIAVEIGLPGLPDLLRRDDVAATYERLSGHAPRDLDFYTFYAALRHGIIMFRIKRRQIRFGEAEMSDDPDDLILHRHTLERMLEGTYWSPATGSGRGPA